MFPAAILAQVPYILSSSTVSKSICILRSTNYQLSLNLLYLQNIYFCYLLTNTNYNKRIAIKHTTIKKQKYFKLLNDICINKR